MVEIKECLRLWGSGHGFRTIATRTGLARNTVKRHVQVAEQLGLQRGEVQRALDDELIGRVVQEICPGGSRCCVARPEAPLVAA
ncbi:MAG: hypothetical protein H6734_20605 [Alphaproteobacteria bacterium]|nr:hypothetical protein [Alphaproteobacteria bacterium]